MSDTNNKDAERESLGILQPLKRFFQVAGELAAWLFWMFFVAVVAIIENLAGYRRARKPDKTAFWTAVMKCLVKFHDMTAEQAYDTANICRSHVSKLTNQFPFYAQTPFKVANDLAGKEIHLSHEDYVKLYLKEILGKK